MASEDRLGRILNNATSAREVEVDVQLQRIVASVQRMHRVGFAPIAYHGKMREADVDALEAMRRRRAAENYVRQR